MSQPHNRFGVHRTATAGDKQTADWLYRQFLGELINVRQRGYSSFGLIGGADPFPWTHTDQDTTASVAGKNLAAIAKAAAQALQYVEREKIQSRGLERDK